MTTRASLATILGLILAACGGPTTPPPADSGLDGGPPPAEDAGIDAPPSEDAGSDAGPPPTPLEMSRDDARADMATLAVELAAADPTLLDAATELRLDVVSTRLDAVIGEKIGSAINVAGVIGEKSTLALRAPAGAILVILRQLATAVIELQSAHETLPADPALDGLRTALQELAISTAALRGELETRWAEIVALDATLPGTEDLAYVDAREINLAPQTSVVRALLEGTPAAADGIARVTCGGATSTTVVVTDDETGSGLGSGAPPISFVVPTDRPTRLRIDISDVGFYPQCRVEIEGRRHFRAAPIMLTTAESADLRARTSDWQTELSILSGSLAMMGSEGTADDMAIAPTIEGYLREMSAETGAWRAMDVSIPPEALDELSIALDVEIALSSALETHPSVIASSFSTNLVNGLAALRAHNEAARTALESP